MAVTSARPCAVCGRIWVAISLALYYIPVLPPPRRAANYSASARSGSTGGGRYYEARRSRMACSQNL